MHENLHLFYHTSLVFELKKETNDKHFLWQVAPSNFLHKICHAAMVPSTAK